MRENNPTDEELREIFPEYFVGEIVRDDLTRREVPILRIDFDEHKTMAVYVTPDADWNGDDGGRFPWELSRVKKT